MSATGPYSRLYHSLVDDPDFEGIYDDDAAFATWVRLLMVADASYPTAAPLPRSAKRRPLQRLQDAGLVEVLPGQRFRVKGLESERGRRAALGRRAAMVRHHSESSADAMQTHSGRSANGLPRREETRKEETSNGANAPGATGSFMGFRQKQTASLDDVRRQEAEAWQKCGSCHKLRRQHPVAGDHPFVAEQQGAPA